MLDAPATLDDTIADAFARLARGVADRRSAFHTPTLGTTGADGLPELRTVVLRVFDARTRTLSIHTDARSAKIGQIERQKMVALHFYDSGAKLQLRLTGPASLHRRDETARAAWQGSRATSRDTYRVHPGPGTPIDGPGQADETALSEGAAFDQFVCVQVVILRLEWLMLAASGHRRARFTWDGERASRTWLVP